MQMANEIAFAATLLLKNKHTARGIETYLARRGAFKTLLPRLPPPQAADSSDS